MCSHNLNNSLFQNLSKNLTGCSKEKNDIIVVGLGNV